MGVISYVLFITAIELTLRWTKVVGINSLAPTGQYMAFILGLGTFIMTLYQILKQEAVRILSFLRLHSIFPPSPSAALAYQVADHSLRTRPEKERFTTTKNRPRHRPSHRTRRSTPHIFRCRPLRLRATRCQFLIERRRL